MYGNLVLDCHFQGKSWLVNTVGVVSRAPCDTGVVVSVLEIEKELLNMWKSIFGKQPS